MADRTVRMTIEFCIDEEALEEHKLLPEDVFRHIRFLENDAKDGFCITTDIQDIDPTCNFFLCDGRVTAQELSPPKAVERKQLKGMIRNRIRQQGFAALGMDEREYRALIHHDRSISLLADEAMRYLSDARVSAADAVECAFIESFPGVLDNFRDEVTVSVIRAGEHAFQDVRLYDLEEGDLVLDCSGYIHSVATEGVPERDYVVGTDYMFLSGDNLVSGKQGCLYEVPCTLSVDEQRSYEGTAYFDLETGDVYNLSCPGLQHGQIYSILDVGQGSLTYNGIVVSFEQDQQGRHYVPRERMQSLGFGEGLSRLETRIDEAIGRQNPMRTGADIPGKDCER